MDLVNRGYDDFEQKIMDDHAGIKVFMQPFYVFHKLDAYVGFILSALMTCAHTKWIGSIVANKHAQHLFEFHKIQDSNELVLCALDMGVATVF